VRHWQWRLQDYGRATDGGRSPPGPSGSDQTLLHLGPPGDAAIPFQTGNASPGHGMGGAPITFGQTSVTVLAQPTPFPPSKLSVFVFEDDFPLNGEQDGGGGVDVLSPNEPGLGGFNITLFDDAGGTGDATDR